MKTRVRPKHFVHDVLWKKYFAPNSQRTPSNFIILTILVTLRSLKIQSSKLYKNKYMISSTQTTNTEIITLIAVLCYKLLSCKVLFINRKKQQKLLKNRLPFKEIANFTGKLLQNYK